MTAIDPGKRSTIDAETLSAVTREVLARLGQAESSRAAMVGQDSLPTSKTDRTAACLRDRVVTAGMVSQLPQGTAELFLEAAAVITPAALDEARARGIAVNRTAGPSAAGSSSVTWAGTSAGPSTGPSSGASTGSSSASSASLSSGIVDFGQPDRAAAVAQQLSRRGIGVAGVKIILSDSPARELYQQCTAGRQVAAMVGALEEVRRFDEELDVTVWVLDMKRLNLTAAVNVAALIARVGRSNP